MAELSASYTEFNASGLVGRDFSKRAWVRLLGWLILCWVGADIAMADVTTATNRIHTPETGGQQLIPTATPGELGYSVTHWTVEDGLPDLTVTSLAQTPDGYLWCGTYSGLVRYDGETFTVFDSLNTPALNDVQIQELRCDSKGRLWIGGSSGELIVYANGRFRRIDEKSGLPRDQAGKMGESQGGGLWLEGISDNRFHHYRKGHFDTVNPGIPASAIDRFIANSKGLEWAVREKERTMMHFTISGPELQPLMAPDGEPEMTLGRFFRLQDGNLAVTSSHGIYALRNSRWRLHTCFPQTVKGQALDGVEDWDGNFWVSFWGVGLVFCQPNGRTRIFALPNQSKSPFIRALMLDADGNVWVAGDDGLYRIRHDAFRVQPSLTGTLGQAANAVIEDSEGSIWILYSKGMARLRKGRWQYLANPNTRMDIATGAPSRDGGFYVAYADPSTRENYVEKCTVDGERIPLGKLNGFVHVILERQDGEVWVGTRTGIWRWRNGYFKRVPITGLSGNYAVYAMVEDAQGRLIASAFRRGLFRQEKNGKWRRLTTTNDLGGDLVVSLYFDDEGTLWAATDRGLARWKHERWHAYGDAGGALPGWVRGIVGDRRGALWLTSQFGVTEVERSALNALADGKGVELASCQFERSDGLPSVTCEVNQQAALRSTDGRIWVATARGAAVVDPEHWVQRLSRKSAPHVRVETMFVDDKSVLGTSRGTRESNSAQIVVPPGASRLEFRYTAINLTGNGKSRFRYRLDGIDNKWVDADDRRSVVYHYLSPGDYCFQVKAGNNYGMWDSSGDSVMFTIEPHWWQTLWFRIGAGTFVIGLLWATCSLKLHQLDRERGRGEEFSRRLMESQEAERQRVARELHDGLGQDLILIRNAANLALRKFAPEPPVQERLHEMVDLASHALANARAVTSNLRPPELDRLGLTAALEAIVDKSAENCGIRFAAAIHNVNGLWPADQEINIYRIVQESVNNALKHADSKCIRLEVKKLPGEVSILLEDDGIGFDPNQLSVPCQRSGMGLTSLQERVRILGGVMELNSSPGAGTSLCYRIPLPDHGEK